MTWSFTAWDGATAHNGPVRGVAATMAFALACAGCTLPKMDPNAPIEKNRTLFGTTYEQGGEPIDQGDMIDRLEEHPKAAEELEGYTELMVTAVILGAVGGGLVGWPIGEAIAGKEDPLWVLAGIGAGVIVVSGGFGVAADNKVENAVDAYNLRFGGTGAQDESSRSTTRETLQVCVEPSAVPREF